MLPTLTLARWLGPWADARKAPPVVRFDERVDGMRVAIYGERLLSLSRIAILTGTSVARLQKWNTLLGILVAAAVSALAAGLALHGFDLRPLARLAAGAALFALVYPSALFLTGQGAELTCFLTALRARGVPAA